LICFLFADVDEPLSKAERTEKRKGHQNTKLVNKKKLQDLQNL